MKAGAKMRKNGAKSVESGLDKQKNCGDHGGGGRKGSNPVAVKKASSPSVKASCKEANSVKPQVIRESKSSAPPPPVKKAWSGPVTPTESGEGSSEKENISEIESVASLRALQPKLKL